MLCVYLMLPTLHQLIVKAFVQNHVPLNNRQTCHIGFGDQRAFSGANGLVRNLSEQCIDEPPQGAAHNQGYRSPYWLI
jgi:hypothetical protein